MLRLLTLYISKANKTASINVMVALKTVKMFYSLPLLVRPVTLFIASTCVGPTACPPSLHQHHSSTYPHAQTLSASISVSIHYCIRLLCMWPSSIHPSVHPNNSARYCVRERPHINTEKTSAIRCSPLSKHLVIMRRKNPFNRKRPSADPGLGRGSYLH